jgi:hypothetical protein
MWYLTQRKCDPDQEETKKRSPKNQYRTLAYERAIKALGRRKGKGKKRKKKTKERKRRQNPGLWGASGMHEPHNA